MTKQIDISTKTYPNIYTLVDDNLFEYLNRWKWHVSNKNGRLYAQTNLKINKKFKSQQMHRLIMNTPTNMHTDHRDGNGLNNTRSNLRICTHAQNMKNMKPRYGSSEYKGVSFHKQSNKWVSRIGFNYKIINLGLFKTQKEAALAYNNAAKKLFGEFAYLNKIEG